MILRRIAISKTLLISHGTTPAVHMNRGLIAAPSASLASFAYEGEKTPILSTLARLDNRKYSRLVDPKGG